MMYTSKEKDIVAIRQRYISGELVRIPGYNSQIPLERFMQIRRYRITMQLLQKYSANANSFLDAGCGTGIFVNRLVLERRLLGENINAVGIDLYAENLDKARKINKHAIFVQADVTQMPFENNSFDLCLFAEVMEHLPNPHKGLAEIQRVLKPGGYLIITTPSKKSIYENKEFVYLRRFLSGIRRIIKGGSFRQPYEPHISLQSRYELKRLLRSKDFEILEEYYTGFCFPLTGDILNILLKSKIFWKLYEVLDHILASLARDFSYSMILVCKSRGRSL